MSRPGIPRIALIWLLVAQVLVIVPHLLHLPLWMIALWLGAAAWRVQIFRMRAPYPGGWVKGGLMLLVLAGILLSRGTLVGLDAAVVLLIATFVLKLLEMRTRRDALVLIFLGFFCVVTAYLFEDGILAALYSLLPVTALLTALVGPARAKLMLFTDARIEPGEAERLGLCERAVPAGGALEAARELAAGIAACPPMALRMTKRTVDSHCRENWASGFEADQFFLSRLLSEETG